MSVQQGACDHARVVNVRRLAAIDMHGLHGSPTRRRIILTEFLAGAIGGLALAVVVIVSSGGTPWLLAFGAWLAGVSLNYVPLALHAISLRRPQVLADELREVDTPPSCGATPPCSSGSPSQRCSSPSPSINDTPSSPHRLGDRRTPRSAHPSHVIRSASRGAAPSSAARERRSPPCRALAHVPGDGPALVGTNSPIESATVTGSSTGTQVLAPLGGVQEEPRTKGGLGRDEVVCQPRVPSNRPGERLLALLVESGSGDAGEKPASPSRGSQRQPDQHAGEARHPATQPGDLLQRGRWEPPVALTVRENETTHSPRCRMAAGQRKQEQPTSRVVGDHRDIVDIEQLETVEEQPSQRGGRSVRPRRQRPRMGCQREVDRDAAIASLEREDDVAP